MAEAPGMSKKTGPLSALSAAALKAVTLKKTATTKTAAQRAKTKLAKQLCEDSADYYKLVKETFFEAYYPKIAHLTFATDYILLSKDDVRALRLEYNRIEGPYLVEGVVDGVSTEATLALESSKTPVELVSLLSAKVDSVKEAKGWPHAFVRMSIRSPKDAALSSAKFKRIVEKEYASLCKVYGETAPDWVTVDGGCVERVSADTIEARRRYLWRHNLRIIACYRAQTYAMAVANGSEAMRLLTRSKRIQGDMHSLLDGTYTQDFQLCVREFRFFDVCFEFRAFVYQRTMTALTQYNDLCFFPDLLKFKEQILAKMQVFVIQTVAALGMDNLVLDLVLVDPHSLEMYEAGWPALTQRRLDALQVRVIEVNPMAEFAGGGMFEWNQDKDVLLGDKAFEFRIQPSLTLYTSADLMPEWKPFVYPPDEAESATEEAKEAME